MSALLLPNSEVSHDENVKINIHTQKKKRTLCFDDPKQRKLGSVQSQRSSTFSNQKAFLRLMLGSKAVHCNALNPFSRQLEIEDRIRCLVRFSHSNKMICEGNVATLVEKLPASLLGNGASGQVYKFEFSNRAFALKVVQTHRRRDEIVTDRRVMNYWLFEAKIGMFFSRYMVGSTNPTLARCPNFVVQYAVEMSSRVPQVSDETFQKLSVHHSYSCVNVLELFDLGLPKALKFDDTTVFNVLQNEELSFSMISQILAAIVSMSAVGVSHNDLALRNILARRTPYESLAYLFPGGCDANDQSMQLIVNTGGVLFAVSDFGLASSYLWEKSGGDVRFDETSPQYGRHGTLTEFYYNEQDAVKHARRGLLLFNAENELEHPLRFDVDTIERDVACFFSNMVSESAKLLSAKRIQLYCLAILDEFDIVGRLQNAAQIAQIAKHVLSRSFVERFFGAEMCDRFYAKELAPHQHVYRLPSMHEGANLERLLEESLNSMVTADCYLRLSIKPDF